MPGHGADERGYQLMTHALRADSVHMVLDAYERLEKAHGARDRRLRIEHADSSMRRTCHASRSSV